MYKCDINKEITYIPREKCFVFLLTHRCPHSTTIYMNTKSINYSSGQAMRIKYSKRITLVKWRFTTSYFA